MFRIYVCEIRGDEMEKVNIRIPIPVPLLGAFMRRRLAEEQALKLLELIRGGGPPGAVEGYIESCMGMELLRVEEFDARRGEWSLVVIGLD